MRPCLLVTLSAGLAYAGSPAFIAQFTDPEMAEYANGSIAVCQDWYPKIAEILFGAGRSTPYDQVQIIFSDQQIAGSALLSTIHLSINRMKQRDELDYRALVVHELTHVIQNYNLHQRCDGLRGLSCLVKIKFHPENGPSWLTEGIADYVTYTYFTKTNRPLLRLDKNGYLFGYDNSIPYLFGLQQAHFPVNTGYRDAKRKVQLGRGYQHGYTVAASFLLWLETRKDRDIVRTLNAALHERHYSAKLFQQHCRAPLDTLWGEFLTESIQSSVRR